MIWNTWPGHARTRCFSISDRDAENDIFTYFLLGYNKKADGQERLQEKCSTDNRSPGHRDNLPTESRQRTRIRAAGRYGRKEYKVIKVYCYSRCSTCKKALKWLDAKEIKYELTDIKKDHPDEAALRKYYQMSGLPLKRFFNTSGIPYRELGLSSKLKEMGEDEQLSLLASDGMLVKRPLVVGDDFVLTGFKEEEWQEKFN